MSATTAPKRKTTRKISRATQEKKDDEQPPGLNVSPDPEVQVTEELETDASPRKRERDEEMEERDDTPSLSRKEKRRLQTQRRLERQIARVSAEASRHMPKVAKDGEPAGGDLQPSEGESIALRHDPKFARGTFWKDRKDKKSRTLFVGNLPGTSTMKTIKDLINAVIAASPQFEAVEGSSSAVTEVDVLPQKFGSRVRHAFVTFVSKELRDASQQLLNGMIVGRDTLRANAADDKSERAAAISKREGSAHLRGGFPRGGVFRGNGGRGGFTGGRGSFNAQGGGRGGFRGGFATRGRGGFDQRRAGFKTSPSADAVPPSE